MHTQLNSKWVTNKDPLCSIWSSAKCCVPAWMGAGFEGDWMAICVWLRPFDVHLRPPQQCQSAIVVVQLLSHVRLFATPWSAALQASLSITNSRSLLKPMSIESVMPSQHLIICHPLLLLPSTFSSMRVFSKDSVLLIRWPKHWSFSFSISPSNEYSGLISFRINWFDLLEVQGTLKSLLQKYSSKA